MEQFLNTYFENLKKAVLSGQMSIDSLQVDCEYCPLREACRSAATNGDERTCGQFIMDGGK